MGRGERGQGTDILRARVRHGALHTIHSSEYIRNLEFHFQPSTKNPIANENYAAVNHGFAQTLRSDREAVERPLKQGISSVRYFHGAETLPSHCMIFAEDLSFLPAISEKMIDEFGLHLVEAATLLVTRPGSNPYQLLYDLGFHDGVAKKDAVPKTTLATLLEASDTDLTTNRFYKTIGMADVLFQYLDDTLRKSWADAVNGGSITSRSQLRWRIEHLPKGQRMLDFLTFCGFDHNEYCAFDPLTQDVVESA